MRRSNFFIFFLILSGIAVAAFLYKKYRVPPSLNVQELQLTDLNGNVLSLSDSMGKNVVLSFFATWCGPCMQEVPLLEQAATDLQDSSYLFLLISDEPVPRLQSFKARTGTSLRIVHSSRPLKQIGIVTYPTNYMLNKQLQVVFNEVGFVDWSSTKSKNKLKELGR